MDMSDWGVTNVDNQTVRYCFPNNNLSCTKSIRAESEYIIVYTFISVTSVFTVFLNLLVIVSISHFKQLHTPTNVLILSLAVADLIAGLILMPVQGMKLIEPCWYFGEIFCSIFPLILYVVVTASLGNLVIISVDRYIAVHDPLRYPLKSSSVGLETGVWCRCQSLLFAPLASLAPRSLSLIPLNTDTPISLHRLLATSKLHSTPSPHHSSHNNTWEYGKRKKENKEKKQKNNSWTGSLNTLPLCLQPFEKPSLAVPGGGTGCLSVDGL
ncbi:hypothetical protein QQF64_006312 [Cirrhinus molitorella]|uniref:G-protein coupled receptors family 1 profile domain-containing protein n=1 Tax=Cirrhinus molitorella TaxID=172907 RepID=A0ABR3MEP3_9TELE